MPSRVRFTALTTAGMPQSMTRKALKRPSSLRSFKLIGKGTPACATKKSRSPETRAELLGANTPASQLGNCDPSQRVFALVTASLACKRMNKICQSSVGLAPAQETTSRGRQNGTEIVIWSNSTEHQPLSTFVAGQEIRRRALFPSLAIAAT